MGWKSKSRWLNSGHRLTPQQFKGSQTVRVLLYHGKPVKIESSSAFEFRTLQNTVSKGHRSYLPASPGKFISQKGEFILNNNVYSGDLVINVDKGEFFYVNHVPLEEYLVSVVGHEMSPKWPLEALKSQAVVARTYVLQKMGESHDKLYDIGDTTKDQVYGGRFRHEEGVRQAIAQTLSQIITYHGELAQVFYHSCCGGETASSEEVWKEDIPYLKRQTCNFTESPEYNWKVTVSKSEMEEKLGIRDISNISILERTESKRAKYIAVKTKGKEVKITASEFRAKIGAERIRSTRFGMKLAGAQIIIKGHGYGHGVGLCQWCSKILAEKQSMKYRNILSHFFPGTSITKI